MVFTVPAFGSTFAKVNERDEMRRAIKKDFIAQTNVGFPQLSSSESNCILIVEQSS